MREYQKQKEKLSLLKLECIIEWTKNAVLAGKAKESRLKNELAGIHQQLRALEEEKGAIMKDLKQENAWTKAENQRRTLKLLEINSK
jgi:hypothetical protein